jgi:thiol:disulfide interchange protein DsbD
VAFAALGGALLAARAGGAAAGWGFQFQSPVFVALVAWLMLAVGLNLSGVFAVGGPAGAGQSLAGRGGRSGAFFTGLLAVVVASPCTAPFMATALGATLALPAPATMGVFLALGLGLALPYALLVLVPGAIRALPRPGPWMARLRQALAFPMYATVVWLAWVLARQSGPDAVLALGAGAVLVGLAAWLVGWAQRADGRGARRVAGGAAALAAIAALALLPTVSAARAAPAAAAAGQAFAADRLAALRTEGRPVLVNMTAAWCLSCAVNERIALDTPAVRAALADGRIALLVGDWTRQDAAIGAFLRAHGRDGVPLYLVYPAGGGPPETLPQLLTEGIVLAALERAVR